MLIAVNTEMLSQTVASVFLNMMSLEVEVCDAPRSTDPKALLAFVRMGGSWEGALLFECGPVEACRFAARFLGIDTPAGPTNDVRDVLGELANMIGGNVKFAVASGLKLSLPTVLEGNSESLRFTGTEPDNCLAFQSQDGSFRVTLVAGTLLNA